MKQLFLVIIAILAEIGCQKSEQVGSAKPKPKNQIGEVISAAIMSEDSAIQNEWSNRLGKKNGAGAAIFVGIYEKYYPAPNLSDTLYFDTNLIRFGVPVSLVNRYKLNKDTVAHFDFPLKTKYKCLYIADSLESRARFEIADLPKKYVKKYCRFKLSKPTFNDDSTKCIFQMQNVTGWRAHMYYLEKENKKWTIIIKAKIPEYLYSEFWVD